MATTIGENNIKQTNNKRFKVTVKVGNKVIHTSVGMLGKSSTAVENYYIRTARNLGFELPKGAIVEATEAPNR